MDSSCSCSIPEGIWALFPFLLLLLLPACFSTGTSEPRSLSLNDPVKNEHSKRASTNTAMPGKSGTRSNQVTDRPSIPEKPLTLSEAIRIGTSRNPDVQTAAQRIQIARARLGQAEAAFYPQLSAGLSYTRTTHPAQGFFMTVAQREFNPRANVNDPGTNENYRTEVTLRYPIYRGGRDANRAEAAEKRVHARKARSRAVKNQLVFHITEAYLAILGARQQRNIAEKSLSTVQAERERVRKQVDQGAALESDVSSLNVRVSEARQKKIRARNAIQEARVALKTLLGFESEAPLQVAKQKTNSVDRSMPNKQDAIQTALSERPEYTGARFRVKALRKRLAAAKGENYPTLQAFGTYGHDNDTFEYTEQKDSWTAGVELSYNLFSGFSTQEKIREARYELREARMNLRKIRLKIRKDVQSAVIRLKNRLAELDVTETSTASAKDALNVVEQQYEEGAVPVTRYLEAETDLTRSRSKQKNALYAVRKARANLERALGKNVHRAAKKK